MADKTVAEMCVLASARGAFHSSVAPVAELVQLVGQPPGDVSVGSAFD